MDPFMQQTEDEAGLMSAVHEQVTTGVQVRPGSSLLAKLKAKRCIALFAEHGKLDEAVIEKDSQVTPTLKAMSLPQVVEDEVAEFHDEELEQENALLREVEQATVDREKRLKLRRKTRALIRIESLADPSLKAKSKSNEENMYSATSSSDDEEEKEKEKERERKERKEKRKKSRFVTLPSIVVQKNGKTVTLPSVVVKKNSQECDKGKKKKKKKKKKKSSTDVNDDNNDGDEDANDANDANDDDDGDNSDDSEDSEEDDEFNVNFDKQPSQLQKETLPLIDIKQPKQTYTSKSRLSIVSKKVLVAIKTRNQRRNAVIRELILDKRTLQQTRNRRKLRDLLSATDVSTDAKGVRLMVQAVDIMGSYWMRAKHIAMLLKHFHHSVKSEKYWGSYRVDVVVSLFSRLVDVHNFELILAQLSAAEAGCVYMRLGWLNLFNPMKVEGSYELEMSRWEERMVAKLLISLALREPGENIMHGSFQWDRDTEKTPGWVITQAWRSDASMHRKGYLSLTYASNAQCSEAMSAELKPDMNYRRALLSTVLIREEELRPEDDIKRVPDTPGKMTLRHLKNYFLEYLYGDRNVENKVTMLLVKTTAAQATTGTADDDDTKSPVGGSPKI